MRKASKRVYSRSMARAPGRRLSSSAGSTPAAASVSVRVEQALGRAAETSAASRPRRLAIIGVPLSAGQPIHGTEAGPEIARQRGLVGMLERSGVYEGCDDLGDIEITKPCSTDPVSYDHAGRVIKNAWAVSSANRRVFESSCAAFASGALPVAVGGDHSMATGTVAAALKNNADVGVLWVDAHADIHTPDTSPSMNMHGMPLSWLMGLADPAAVQGFEWLTDANVPRLRSERLVYVGLRDVDPPERVMLKELGVTYFTMHDIDKLGVAKVMQLALEELRVDEAPMHVSYDIDAVDPFSAPATGTMVPGGLSFREANYIAEAVAECGALCSLDMVEVNPSLATTPGSAEKTADMGNTLVGAMLGDTLM